MAQKHSAVSEGWRQLGLVPLHELPGPKPGVAALRGEVAVGVRGRQLRHLRRLRRISWYYDANSAARGTSVGWICLVSRGVVQTTGSEFMKYADHQRFVWYSSF